MALFIINIHMDTGIFCVFTGFYMPVTFNKSLVTIKCQCCDNTPHWALHILLTLLLFNITST